MLNKGNGNLSSIVDKARIVLHETQTAISLNPADLSILQSQILHSQELWYALSNEEKLAKQKSRIQWLKDGDKNTGYFHNQIKNRWNQNKILAIVNSDGVIQTGQKDIQDTTVNHFCYLMGSASQTCS